MYDIYIYPVIIVIYYVIREVIPFTIRLISECVRAKTRWNPLSCVYVCVCVGVCMYVCVGVCMYGCVLVCVCDCE